MILKRCFLSVAMLALACVFAVKPAAADSVLYDSAPLTSTSTPMFGFAGIGIAGQFTLTDASTITGFDANVATHGGLVSQYSWAITTTPGGNPLASSTVTNPNQFVVGNNYYANNKWSFTPGSQSNVVYYGSSYGYSYVVYHLDSPADLSLALGAGTYYLELIDGTAALANGSQNVVWDASMGSGTTTQFWSDGTSHTYTNVATSFQISGSANTTPNGGSTPVSPVPEPSSLSLLGLGLAGIVGVMKFKNIFRSSALSTPNLA